ncbi:C2H2-type domain-containing protein, partial [Haematococcus lacustris]
DQVLQWVKEGRWDRVVQEKRNVLVCMQQVLHSCYTLLDRCAPSTQCLAGLCCLKSQYSSRTCRSGQGSCWAAVSELLKLLRPGASGTPSSALGLLPDAQLLLQAQQNLLS